MYSLVLKHAQWLPLILYVLLTSWCLTFVQDPTLDRTSLYVDMVKAHRWLDRVHEYTHHMASILQQNNLKRSNNQVFCNKRRQRLPVPRGHNVPQP